MKTLRNFAALTVLALALAVTGFAQTANPSNKQFLSPDSTFTLVLPGTPQAGPTTNSVTPSGQKYVLQQFDLADTQDNLKIGIVEANYDGAIGENADAALINFNRTGDITVVAPVDIKVPGADSSSAEIVDSNGSRALIVFAVRGSEVIALIIATDNATGDQVEELTAIYKSFAFNTAATN